MQEVILDEHRDLFRSDAAFAYFVSLLETPTGTTIWAGRRKLGTLMSPTSSDALLSDRVVQRLADSPSLLVELRDRLENDEIVD